MKQYIARRIGYCLLSLFLLSVTIFFFVRVTGDPATLLVEPGASQADLEAIRHQFGLDQPLWVQYGIFMASLAHGDLGQSFYYRTPVLELYLSRLPNSIYLAVVAMVLSLVNPPAYSSAFSGCPLNQADINQDGKMDGIIGAPNAAGTAAGEGRAYHYLSNGVVLTSPTIPQAPNPAANVAYGTSVAFITDAAGVPTAAAIGMPGHSTNSGRVYVHPIQVGGALGVGAPLDAGTASSLVPTRSVFGFVGS